MIKELLAMGKSEQEVKDILIANGYEEKDALFAIDIVQGREVGDYFGIDEDGNRRPFDPSMLRRNEGQ